MRVDSGVQSGAVIAPQFDSMMAKLIVHGTNRAQALARARRALAEFTIEGVPSVLPFHRAVLAAPAFCTESAEGFTVHTRWIETDFARELPSQPAARPDPASAALLRRPIEITAKIGRASCRERV